jgi:hypothetical protein
MSEVQSRPTAPRGRGSARGGRGGFSARGGRGGRGHATNGDKTDTTLATSIEDEGEVGLLKKQYGSSVTIIKEMFPGWTDEDIVFALQETNGDLETTVERITDGKTLTSQAYCFKPNGVCRCGFNDQKLTVLVQVRSHNGERFRRPRRIDPDLRPRMLRLQHLATPQTRAGSHAAVELALTVQEEAVVVAQTEAEVDEVAEHPSRTQMVRARRIPMSRPLLLSRLPGILPPLTNHRHGVLLNQLMKAGSLLSLLRRRE